jgi:BirA family transcriptional regulator, biotin operon repressor / biotin---[acetyl-CoA-carboxylase] ligase
MAFSFLTSFEPPHLCDIIMINNVFRSTEMTGEELSSYSIQKVLKTAFIGRNIIYYPTLNSTMDTAREAARQSAPEGTVIIAGEQMGGRGRLGRKWITPRGNLALSMILYPDIECLPYLIMIASLAAAHSIEALSGLKAGVKWPNDILIEGKKVCGILIENEMKGKKVAYSIVGIGINIILRPAEIEGLTYPATGLEEVSGQKISIIELAGCFLNEFENWYRHLPDGKAIYEAWREKLVTLGKQVKAKSGNQVIEGIAEAVDEGGALIVRRADGNLTKIVAGEVTLRENG